MGTSSSNKGSRRGLVPTWVGSPSPAPAPKPALTQPPALPANPSPAAAPRRPTPPQPQPQTAPTPPVLAAPLPALPAPSTGASLGSARGDFTRAARSGGRSGLRRAASKYVRAVGGAGAATRILSPSRGVATDIGRFAADALQRDPVEALRTYNLESMAGAPASDVFETLADIICPAGGTIDEAIARESMLAAAAELAGTGMLFDDMPAAALEAIFLGSISRSIENKLFNELGSRAVKLPEDVAAVQRIERELHSYVSGAVRDAFGGTGESLETLDPARVDSVVANIYERTFEVLRVLGESA